MSSNGGAGVPYLALKHVTGSDAPTFFAVSGKKMAIGIDDGMAELKKDNCWATPQGWVLVRSAASSSTFLLDPHHPDTRIPLPHLPDEDLPSACTCLLSGYPDPSRPAATCLVLLIEPDATILRYCRIGGGSRDEWVKHEYDIGTQDLGGGCSEKLVVCSVAGCQGKFYFNGTFQQLDVLEFRPGGPAFGSVAVHDAVEQPLGGQQVFLVESWRELFMVSLLSFSDVNVVYQVLVHRMDFSRQEWHQVSDIGDRAFLLSPWYFGASRSASECGLEPNCVYMVYASTKCVKMFNIKDGTAKVQDLDEAPGYQQALWMLPTHP